MILFKEKTMKTKLRVLGDKILVKRKEVTPPKGGIYIPDSAKEKPKQGTVVAVGVQYIEGIPHTLQVQVGDEVLFASFSGTEITVDKQEYIVMTENDVLVVL